MYRKVQEESMKEYSEGGQRYLKGAISVIAERTRDFPFIEEKQAALQKSDQLDSKREELGGIKQRYDEDKVTEEVDRGDGRCISR